MLIFVLFQYYFLSYSLYQSLANGHIIRIYIYKMAFCTSPSAGCRIQEWQKTKEKETRLLWLLLTSIFTIHIESTYIHTKLLLHFLETVKPIWRNFHQCGTQLCQICLSHWFRQNSNWIREKTNENELVVVFLIFPCKISVLIKFIDK